MTEINFFSAIIIGLAGGVHCIGMCGGVVGALNYAIPQNKPTLNYSICYNLGRICSYTLAGALTGYLGSIFRHQISNGALILQCLSIIFLLALACYISGLWNGLTHIEKVGQVIWQRIQPVSKRFIPFRTPFQAIPYGMIWGWLPCGLVYSTLTWSLASGSALSGASLMLGFGIGTLPTLLLVALGFEHVRNQLQGPLVKKLMAVSIALVAIWQVIKIIN